MLEIGQPMHAFDSDKIGNEIVVKNAYRGQRIITLDKKDVELDENVLLITDGENPLAIAGIKGGNFAELETSTKNIILESASFDAVQIRKTSQRLKIQTDASKRYENDFSVEVAGEAMDILSKLIVEIAGTSLTKVGEIVDNYPKRANKFILGISSKEASSIIGVEIKDSDIEKIFDKFGFEWKKVKPIDEVLKIAQTLIGVPYKRAASISYDAPKSFDCSGFVSYLFVQAGIQIPRMSVDQYVFGKKINKGDLIPGDTIYANAGVGKIFYNTLEFLPGTNVPEGVDHCGLYLGNGKVIHATMLFDKVVIEDLDKSERFKNIVGYRRMTENLERFVITVPDERLDLRIKEDLAEEIGRIYGYDKIKDISISKNKEKVKIEKGFAYKEKIRRILYEKGFSEVINYSFTDKGEIELANPMSPERKFLRTNLSDGLNNCLEFNSRYSELVDMLQIKIERAKDALPKETLSAINSIDWRAAILGMKDRKGYSFEQLEDLELETELLLCGLAKPEGYPKALEQKLKISRPQADLLVQEMNEFVFKKIKDELIKNSQREEIFIKKDTEKIGESGFQDIMMADKPKETNVKSDVPMPPPRPATNEQLRITNYELKTTTPNITESVKTDTPVTPTSTIEDNKKINSILNQKLSGPVQSSTVKTEYTLPSLGSDKTAPATVNKTSVSKADPYRMDPNE
ncbi:MAG: phenylalanine--tRNA ligase beta subunit-related protein, partial [Candidatus Staskawiczbacteria bacterium]